MMTTVSLAVSLYQGRAIRDHVEDLSLIESRYTKLPERLSVQARTATAATTTFASVAVATGRAGLTGRMALLPMAMMGLECAVALVMGCTEPGSRVSELGHRLSRFLPKVTASALVAGTVALALLQPLAGVGLALHGLVALAERRQWVSAKAISVLLLSTTVVGLGLGLGFGPPMIKCLLVVEVLTFIARRLDVVKRSLGLCLSTQQGAESQAGAALGAIGLPDHEQPEPVIQRQIGWDDMINPLTDLQQRFQVVASGLQRPPSAGLWSASSGQPGGSRIPSLAKREWAGCVMRLQGQLGELEYRSVAEPSGSWLRAELAAAATDLPGDSEHAAAKVLRAFAQLNQQFLAGSFGPGSITSPELAQEGWGRCLHVMGELLPEAGEVDQERKALVLRAIAQLVHKTHESCSGTVLCAVEECFDTLRSVDRLQEGFFGFLRRVGTEEASEWQRNAMRWPRSFLEGLSGFGLPGAQRLRAYVGRPDGTTAMAGAERMPWLSTSQTSALAMVRRSAVSELEVGILGTQIWTKGWNQQEITSRLSSVRLVVDQAVHFLLSPEGRMAWHQTLGKADFQQWVREKAPSLQDQLDQLGLPSDDQLGLPSDEQLERLERAVPDGQQPFGSQQRNVMPRRLWAAAILLLDYCGLLSRRPIR